MRVLYLSQYFPPEIGATQTRAREMATGLIEAGHQITVVTEVPNHPEGIIRPEYRGRLWARERGDGIDVIRVWVKVSPTKSLVARLAFYWSYMASATLAGLLLARGSYDLIYATSPPLFVGGAALALSRLRRLPLVFEVRDLWPQSAIELGELHNPRAIRMAEALEGLCYQRSVRMVAVTRGILQELLRRGHPEEKLVWIPNGANTVLYQPRPKDPEIVKGLGLEGKFVAIYTGLHGLIHGMECIIECARILRDQKDLLFLLLGGGVKKGELKAMAEGYGLRNILFLPEQPESELPRYLSCADAGLATTKRLKLCEGTLPVKMFSYMACGLPVILAVNGEAREVLTEAGAGLHVEPENPVQLAQAVMRLKENAPLKEEYGRKGRDFVMRHYDRKKLAERLEKVLREVTEAGAVHPR